MQKYCFIPRGMHSPQPLLKSTAPALLPRQLLSRQGEALFFFFFWNALTTKHWYYTNSTKFIAGLSFNLLWLLIDNRKIRSSVKRPSQHPVCKLP